MSTQAANVVELPAAGSEAMRYARAPRHIPSRPPPNKSSWGELRTRFNAFPVAVGSANSAVKGNLQPSTHHDLGLSERPTERRSF
jgi:hypothetical protein